MKKRAGILIGIIILLWSVQPTTGVAQQSKDIILAGYKMKPAVRTTGSGFVTVTLRNDSLSVDGEFNKQKNTFALSEGQLALLKKGNLYITIASQEHQTGEILGKIPPMQ